MNSIKDFQKKSSGAVVNTNSKDYMRARNRNYIRRVQQQMFGDAEHEGDIAKVVRYQNHDHKVIKDIEKDIKSIKRLLEHIVGEK